jgi:O-antigen/teichoic acid export membrane protein
VDIKTASGKKDYLGDSLKYLPSLFVSSLVGILMIVFPTHLFTSAAYGDYTLAVTVMTFFQVIVTAWLSSSIIRFYAVADIARETRELSSTAFLIVGIIALVGSLLVISVTAILRGYISVELQRLLLILPLQMVADSLLLLPLQVIRARRRLGLYTGVAIARTLMPPAAGLATAWFMSGNIIGMLIGSAIASWLLVPFAYLGAYKWRYLPSPRLFKPVWAKTLVAFGAPLVPSLLFVQVLDISDRFLIGVFRGSSEVGIYNASYRLASLPIDLIVTLIVTAAAVLIVSSWEYKGRAATETFLTFLTRVFFIVGVPATVGLSLLSKDVMRLLTPLEYADGWVIIPFVALGSFVVGLQWIAQRGLMLENRTMRILLFFSIAGVANILGNILLVPRFGYQAAAWTTLAAYIVLLILIAGGSAPYLTWRLPYLSIVRSMIACTVMGLIIFMLQNSLHETIWMSLLLKITCGLIAYILCLVLLGEIPLKRLLISARVFITSRNN